MSEELFSPEAEREVCGALLYHGRDALIRIGREPLLASAFSPQYGGAYRVLRELAEQNMPVSPASVREAALRIAETSIADRAAEMLEHLADALGTVSDAQRHAEIVSELSARRDLLATADAMRLNASNRTMSVARIVSDSVGAIVQRAGHLSRRSASDGIWEALEDIERDSRSNGGIPGIASGITWLDRLTDGWYPGRLVVFGARPGCGKTALAVWCAHYAAGEVEEETYFVTLEQPEKQLQKRRLSIEAQIDMRSLRRREAYQAQEKELHAAAARMKPSPLTFDSHANTVSAISLAVQHHSATHRPVKLLIIDYLDQMRIEGQYDRHDLALGAVCQSLADLAKELDLCVIVLVQVNRGAITNGKARRPTDSDLKNSGGIEQAADQIILAWEPEPAESDAGRLSMTRNVELVLAKNRHGPLGSVKVTWYPATNTYVNLDRFGKEQAAA